MTLAEAAARVKFAAIGVIKRRDTNRLTKKHRKAVSSFFRAQKKLVLEKLSTKRFLFSESFWKLTEEAPVDFTKQNWQTLWDEVGEETDFELQQVITKIEAEAMSIGARAANNLFVAGKGGSFDLTNPRAVNWFLDHGGTIDYIKDIQGTTRDQLQSVIVKAIDKGQSYTQTAKEISSKFDVFSTARAQRIAVYETGQAYEAGNRMLINTVADQGIQMEEHWMTSQDDKVRPEHTANEDEGWQPLGHVYSSGDTEPPTDPGCRCYKIYQEVPAQK